LYAGLGKCSWDSIGAIIKWLSMSDAALPLAATILPERSVSCRLLK